MAYPDMGGNFSPMIGLSGMGGQDMGVSPYAAKGSNGLSNQQFQDPNAWLTQMLQTQPGLAGTGASPGMPGATVDPSQAAAGAPSAPPMQLPSNPLVGSNPDPNGVQSAGGSATSPQASALQAKILAAINMMKQPQQQSQAQQAGSNAFGGMGLLGMLGL